MVDFKKLNEGSRVRRELRSCSCIESENHDYRYWLARNTEHGSPWRLAYGAHPGIIFVMLNPSTAREHVRDPTDRRCQAFAGKFGAAWYGIVNLFATSSSEPKSIFDFGYDAAVGASNDEIIAAVFREALDHNWPVVCAWGAPSLPRRYVKLVRQRALEVMTAYNARRVATAEYNSRERGVAQVYLPKPGDAPQPLYCLAHTADKWPRHPLYLGLAEGELLRHSIDTYSE